MKRVLLIRVRSSGDNAVGAAPRMTLAVEIGDGDTVELLAPSDDQLAEMLGTVTTDEHGFNLTRPSHRRFLY